MIFHRVFVTNFTQILWILGYWKFPNTLSHARVRECRPGARAWRAARGHFHNPWTGDGNLGTFLIKNQILCIFFTIVHRFFFYSHPPKVFACEYFFAITFYQSGHANTKLRIHFQKKRINPGDYFFSIFRCANTHCRVLFCKMTLAIKNWRILFPKTTPAINYFWILF